MLVNKIGEQNVPLRKIGSVRKVPCLSDVVPGELKNIGRGNLTDEENRNKNKNVEDNFHLTDEQSQTKALPSVDMLDTEDPSNDKELFSPDGIGFNKTEAFSNSMTSVQSFPGWCTAVKVVVGILLFIIGLKGFILCKKHNQTHQPVPTV